MQFWDWMREAFLPMMYAGAWYNGLKENQTMYVGDKRSLLVGMPRARQLRVKPREYNDDAAEFLNSQTKPSYTICHEKNTS